VPVGFGRGFSRIRQSVQLATFYIFCYSGKKHRRGRLGRYVSAFLKVLCPQKSFDQNTDKVSSSWGRTQSFCLGNKQSFYLLISDVSLLSVDLKSPAENTDQQILSYKCYV